MLDPVSRAFYEQDYKIAYLEKKGTAFQDFFSSIMEKRYPKDFRRIRPWGNVGDMKNDGYIPSESILFQLYAPNEMKAKEAISKIDEDFNGALQHWNIKKWVFVHNSFEGLGPEISKKLDELATNNTKIKITHWGFEEIRYELFKLNAIDLASLFGQVPTNQNINDIGYKDLIKVLKTIAVGKPIDGANLDPVPSTKLAANALSEDVAILLKAGMRKARLVEDFFSNYYDPKYGDEIAEAFKNKYHELKQDKYKTPDQIFQGLQQFAGGAQRREPEYESAILAVLAHLFEKCDIFERPREG